MPQQSALDWDKRPTLATLLHVMARTRRGVLAGVALTVLVALGAGVAVVLGDELGIRSEPADIPSETLVAAPETPTISPPEFTQVIAPASARMDLAVSELRDAVADAGATAVVQPGGSVRDAEVIAAADERGLAMVFTGRRHFRH